MIGTALKTCTACLLMWTVADSQGVSPVVVLDGPEVQHLHDALSRVTCPFRSIARLDSAALTGCRVLVLSGKKPPLESRDAKTIEQFVQSGGAVLAIGGGATWMIQHKLFDADGYLTGTPSNPNRRTTPSVPVPASDDWKPWEAELLIPEDVSYAKPILTFRGTGELCLDKFTLQRLPRSE